MFKNTGRHYKKFVNPHWGFFFDDRLLLWNSTVRESNRRSLEKKTPSEDVLFIVPSSVFNQNYNFKL
jgi:hypothetical protein